MDDIIPKSSVRIKVASDPSTFDNNNWWRIIRLNISENHKKEIQKSLARRCRIYTNDNWKGVKVYNHNLFVRLIPFSKSPKSGQSD